MRFYTLSTLYSTYVFSTSLEINFVHLRSLTGHRQKVSCYKSKISFVHVYYTQVKYLNNKITNTYITHDNFYDIFINSSNSTYERVLSILN